MRRSLVVVLILLLVPAVTSAQIVFPDRGPLVSVTGKGVVEADPDMALVLLGVYVLDKDLPQGKATSDAATARLLRLAETLGIQRADVSSARFNIEPQYGETETHDFLGYAISRSVEITLRDLSLLDRLIDQAIQSGANREFNIDLRSSRERELRQQALDLAIENAKEQAERLASGFGAKLGPVRSIDTSGRYSVASSYTASTIRIGQGTFQPGTLRFEVDLAASFSLGVQ